MYEFESRVRYSEVDAKGELKMSALVNYLQDCSTFQSEDLGIGVSYLKERGIAWVLNNWQIDIKRLPILADRIIIGTIPYEIKGFIGYRNFYVKDASTGEILVQANTIWTLLDMVKLRPVKADQRMLDGYAVGEKLDMEYTDRKVVLEGDYKTGELVTITRYMLDTNMHVNNEQYIEMALTFIANDKKVVRLRSEYRKSAYLGDILIPAIYENEGKTGVSFTKQGETEPCVICEFMFDL